MSKRTIAMKVTLNSNEINQFGLIFRVNTWILLWNWCIWQWGFSFVSVWLAWNIMWPSTMTFVPCGTSRPAITMNSTRRFSCIIPNFFTPSISYRKHLYSNTFSDYQSSIILPASGRSFFLNSIFFSLTIWQSVCFKLIIIIIITYLNISIAKKG